MKSNGDSVSSSSGIVNDISFLKEHAVEMTESGVNGQVYFEKFKLDNGKTAVVEHQLSVEDLASIATDDNITKIVME